MQTKKVGKIFSEEFKKKKIKLLEQGQIRPCELSKLYDVSITSIYKWKAKYGNAKDGDRVVIESESDFLKLVELKKEVKNLENLIGKQQIKLDYYETLINQLKTEYGEDFEKKFGQK